MKAARTLLLAVALAVTAAAHAQTCVETDTPLECLRRFVPSANQLAATTNAVGTAVATTNTGTPNLSSIENSALRDFLSVFTAAFQTGNVDQKDGAWLVDYNLPVDLFHERDVIKLQARFAKPELDPQLKAALGDNTGAISTLSGTLDEADDITASATYSPMSLRFGRSFAAHRPLIEAMLHALVVEAGVDDPVLRAAELGGVARGAAGFQLNRPMTDVTDAVQRAKIVEGVRDLGRTAASFATASDKLIAQLAELINRQDQVYGSFQYHDRNELAGANGWSLKATYEVGGGSNISRFLEANAQTCNLELLRAEINAANAPNGVKCLTALRSYLTGEDPAGDRKWRFAGSLDLQQNDETKLALSEYGIDLTLPETESRIVSITAGKRLDPPTSTRERRIDLTGAYENVSGDANRDDRVIASLTYTQELTDSFTLPLTLTYANKEKYLTGVDDKLSVHFGLSYKLPKLNR